MCGSSRVMCICGEDREGEVTRCEIHQMHRGCTEDPGMGDESVVYIERGGGREILWNGGDWPIGLSAVEAVKKVQYMLGRTLAVDTPNGPGRDRRNRGEGSRAPPPQLTGTVAPTTFPQLQDPTSE